MNAAVAMGLVTAVTGLAPAAALTTGPSAAHRSAGAPVTSRVAEGPRAVLLVNGDRLVVTPAAGGQREEIAPSPVGGLAGGMLAVRVGGSAFYVPQVALPYLGHGLAPSLFEVSALLRRGSPGRLPVTVSYRHAVPSLPGVTMTRAGRGMAAGYLTAAGARRFGAALSRQFEADHARGGYGRDGMFAGGVTVSLAGAPTSPGLAGTPRRAAGLSRGTGVYPLRVTGTDLEGGPDTGDSVYVFNVDDSTVFAEKGTFHRGVATFQVPAGHYFAVGVFFENSAQGAILAERLDVLPQFTVAHGTTVRVGARAANSEVASVTPRRATVRDTIFDIIRQPSAGPPISISALQLAGTHSPSPPVWVSRTSHQPTVGTLQTIAVQQLDSPPGVRGLAYEYNLDYLGSGVIGPQHRVVRPGSLATVRDRYYYAVRSDGGLDTLGLSAAQAQAGAALSVLWGVRQPLRLTHYLTAGRSIVWVTTLYGDLNGSFAWAGGQSTQGQIFTPGERLTENWNAYPLHPGYNANLIGAVGTRVVGILPVQSSASRTGDVLSLHLTPFTDNQPGHIGGGFVQPNGLARGSYEIDQNGKKIAAGNAVSPATRGHSFATQVKLSGAPSVIRLVLGATRTGPQFPLSAASRTVWTWRSAPGPGTVPPPGWACGGGYPSCTVQPMLTLRYGVAGLALDGSTRPGRQVLRLTVAHLPLARSAPVTRASVSVSFDGGQTWHPAHVTGHGGAYTATFSAPAGAIVTLRASAADAASGRITETITGAYRTSPG